MGNEDKTYRGVDGLIASKVTALAKTVMSLAEGDARKAPGDQASVDGAAAAEEGVVPRLRSLRGLGVDVLAGTGDDIVDTVLPLVEVIVVDGTVVVLVLGGSGHCERLFGYYWVLVERRRDNERLEKTQASCKRMD
jgi:hypothetical protein